MKRQLLIISFLLIALGWNLTLHSQVKAFDRKLYIGVGGGASLSSMDFIPNVPQTTNLTYWGGVSVKLHTQKYLGLIGEVNFTQRGWKEDYDPTLNYAYNRTLNFIEVPFMTHVYFGNKVRMNVNIGPQVSFLIGDKQKMSDELQALITDQQARYPDAQIGEQYMDISRLNKVDYGLVAGLGVELPTRVGSFVLEGRYYFGFGDTFPNNRANRDYFSRSANRLIQAKFTYYFPLFVR